MRWFDLLQLRLRTLFFRDRLEAELKREFDFHLEQQIAENLAAGMPPQHAREAAVRKIGGLEQYAEQCRDARGLHLIESTTQDLRYALRSLRKSPAFTAVAVLSLALGIGANIAIFSLVDSLILQQMPVRDPQNLFFVRTQAVKTGNFQVSRNVTSRDLDQMLHRSTQVENIAAYQQDQRLSIGVDRSSELAPAELVSGTFFDLLGVRPALGRTLTPADDSKTGNASSQGWPAMISYGFWQRRFAANPNVLGKPITVNTIPCVIVGVTPPGFMGFSLDEPTSVFLPLITSAQIEQGSVSAGFTDPDDTPGFPIVRLKSGIDSKKAEAELTVIFHQTELENKGNDADDAAVMQKLNIELQPASQGESSLRRRYSDPLRALLAVVGAVMLIACGNIAGLLIARGKARQKEIAIRIGLGSTRPRILRQLLTESLLLSLLGCSVGILFAIWARHSIVSFATQAAPSVTSLPMRWDWHLFAFLAALCVGTAVLFGLAPAWMATRVDPQEALKSAQSSHRSGRLPFGRILVAGQIALSLALVVGAGLFLGTLRKLYHINLGFNQEHLLMVTMDPHLIGYSDERSESLYKQLLERVRELSGVQSATFVDSPLFSGRATLSSATVVGYIPKTGEELSNHWTVTYAVGPDFFSTLEMPLKEGRDFTKADNSGAPAVVVINESFAKHYFSGKVPIGQKVSFRTKNRPDAEIVGVVRDAHYFSAQWETQEAIFTPMLQVEMKNFSPEQTLIVRTAGDPDLMAGDLRAALRNIDPNLPIYDMVTMSGQVASTFSQERLLAILSTFFGLLALVLSAIGLYGALSYGVTQRTGEIGIRMALGADRGNIFRLVLNETTLVLAGGITAGIALAWAGSRLIRTLLYGISDHDVRTFVFAVLVLACVALLAALLPARRAVRVDPLVALRYE
ncbi:MAG TPA: ABC transporter permease [Terriglobales bacterium]|nr:ABC transporter permease [Terriglobales bacterium]